MSKTLSDYAKPWAALGLYLVLGAVVFYQAVKIGFLGDFAGDILLSQGNWWASFSCYRWNFYISAMALYHYLYKWFGLTPAPYHIFQLFLIIVNAWLIYYLARLLGFKNWQCWIAGLLALLNSTASEAYFWLSAIPKVVATTLSLIALISIIRWRQSLSRIWAWSYVIIIVVALTWESTVLILPLLGLVLDHYCRQRWPDPQPGSRFFAGYGVHFLTFAYTGLFLLFRQFLGIRPYVVNLPLLGKMRTLVRTTVGTFYHGLDDHLMPFNIANLLLIVLFLILLLLCLSAWKMKSRPERGLLLTLLLLWLGACLPHTIGANVCSRYFYFPGVFVSLVTVDLLGAFSQRFHSSKVAIFLIAASVVVLLSLDMRAFRLAIDSYLAGTRTYDRGIRTIRSSLKTISPGMKLVLVDFPDSFYSRQGAPNRYQVLVYRNALPAHLILLYKTQLNATLLRLSSPSPDNPYPMGIGTDAKGLARVMESPQVAVCRYLPSQDQFIMMKVIGNLKEMPQAFKSHD